MNMFEQKTNTEIILDIAHNLVRIRKEKKITQKELSKMSGVSFASLKRFEQTGEISLNSLVKLSLALGVESELDSLFSEVMYESIEEAIGEQSLIN